MIRKAVALFIGLALIPLAVPAGASKDTAYAKQWALPLIKAPEAWQSATGAGIKIGIVDSGVDLAHEDLVGQILDSTSCVDTSGEALLCDGKGMDDNGHGTHVSGIAAATRDNNLGVAGVAPDAQILMARVTGDEQGIDVKDVVAGIKWVVDRGAKVVNLSLGDALFVRTQLYGNPFQGGIDYAWSKGAIPVLASGNENVLGAGIGSAEYGDINAVVVGAVGPDDLLSTYSSPTGNAKWAIIAPGGDDGELGIYSSLWEKDKHNQYGYMSGTSMAAPHVTGALAVLLSMGLDKQQAIDALLAGADKKVSCGFDSATCAGRLDLAASVAAAKALR